MRRVLAILLLGLLGLTGCSAAVMINEPAATTAQPAANEANPAGAEERTAAGPEDCVEEVAGACATEDLLQTIVTYLTFFAELCGALVIAVGVIRALWRFVPHIFRHERDEGEYKENIRLQLGKSLALALEFELGADILKTAVAPTLQIIGQLAAIIILRTLLNYFLERELRQVEERRANRRLDDERPLTERQPQP